MTSPKQRTRGGASQWRNRLFQAAMTMAVAGLTLPAMAQDQQAPEVEQVEADPSVQRSDVQSATPSEAGVTSEPVQAAANDGRSTLIELPAVTVVGSAEEARRLPGSATFLGPEEIQRQNYADINRILRRVPGVYIREEDGLGLFPNISLRGVDTTRSSKVTLMEDGVLAAPAPYSAPSAYYSPNAGRMHAVEVLKGSSQIKFGPHITGGVVNYVSTPIPEDNSTYLRATYGEFNEMRVHAWHGNTMDLDHNGRVGYLIEGYYRSNDGFKDIMDSNAFAGDQDTGVTLTEPMLKLSWEPDSERYQRWEFKLGYTDLEANETYLGLAEQDFNSDPYDRYPASKFDEINTWHTRTYLRHYIEFTDDVDLTSTVYYNRFHRNWQKLGQLQNIDTDGDGVPDGVNMGLSEAIAGANGGVGLDVLRGNRAADLRVDNNNRDYYQWGVDTVTRYRFDWGQTDHEITFGLRYHQDRVRRYQWREVHEQDATGAIADNDGDGIVRTDTAGGSAGNRRQETQSVAVFLQDEIAWDNWTITPGIRYEHLWQEHSDFQNPARIGEENQMDLLGGGIGVNYKFNPQWSAFGGSHYGFSPPDPRAATGPDKIEEESSWANEVGVRYLNQDRELGAELVGFYTHYNDLLVIDNGAAGGTPTENVGEVDVFGVELSAEYDAGKDQGWGVSNPWWVAVTYTNATLDGDASSQDPESLFAGGQDGNDVPYIPDWQISFGTGVEWEKVGLFVTAHWVDESYTTASNVDQPLDPTGSPDARFGKTDAHFVVDLSAHWQVNDNTKLIAGVQNLFDEEYVASRHPHGLRPGKPRFAWAGVEITF